ncbi:hypothetical protein AVEN_93520-1 [Araneus ventricosus]|uniref:DDE-1 domain-containing protein n=1 Tax=Araneus ventricosus TaxID=182803 RepID=A0A4Y2ARC9_ARAVE|nr:hypothetical protein AVEN_93520-1 [Araneus ventricosus]
MELFFCFNSYQTWCLETTLTLREYSKYHFHIVSCLKMIEDAWEEVTKRTLTSAWKRLWSLSNVTLRSPVEPMVNAIVSLAKIRGLEVDSIDIDQLVEKHSQQLTTEEVMELHREFVRGGNSNATIF